MSGKPAEDQRDGLARILIAWINRSRSAPPGPHRLVAAVQPEFSVAEPNALRQLLVKGGPSVNMLDRGLWVVGEPSRTHHPVIPVVTAALTEGGDAVTGTVRVALFHQNGETVEAIGYRFESPESKAGQAHDYPHAQAVGGWRPAQRCLHHAHDVGEDTVTCRDVLALEYGITVSDNETTHMPIVNEERPAFPLAAGKTLPGLAASMLASVYGRPYVVELLESDANLRTPQDPAVRRDLAFVLS